MISQLSTVARIVQARTPKRPPLPFALLPDPMTPRDWPGMSRGVRAPEAGETPLSWDEVVIGVREGVL